MRKQTAAAAIFFLVLAFILAACGGGVASLTVKEMVFQDVNALPITVVLEDNKGETVAFGKDPSTWFTNASFVNAYSDAGTTLSSNGQGQMVLADGSHITHIFEVDGEEYSVDVGNGTAFKVEPDGEGYAIVLDDNWRPGGMDPLPS